MWVMTSALAGVRKAPPLPLPRGVTIAPSLRFSTPRGRGLQGSSGTPAKAGACYTASGFRCHWRATGACGFGVVRVATYAYVTL